MEELIRLFTRDLKKLSGEIEIFENPENLWAIPDGISNSAGNLCLHLIGNLNHFIGAVIGNTGYIRDRDAEFGTKDIEKDKLIEMVFETRAVVANSLKEFEPDRLKTTYPIQVFGEDMTYEFFLMHLVSHLSYHLGQINYLRRILES
ncbi:MAG: DUF1572 domain-containing protein [Cytophagales bacterium]|nr:DUF1572 domain-containing protein [Cytophagales bacterium]